MTEPTGRRKEDQVPRKRPSNGKEQLNVWITKEAKQYLDERYEQEGWYLNEQIEEFIRKDMAVRRGEVVEQQSLPLINELIETKLRKHLAQFRTDLQDDLYRDIVAEITDKIERSTIKIGKITTRAARDGGINRHMHYTSLSKAYGPEFAEKVYQDAKEQTNEELMRPKNRERRDD